MLLPRVRVGTKWGQHWPRKATLIQCSRNVVRSSSHFQRRLCDANATQSNPKETSEGRDSKSSARKGVRVRVPPVVIETLPRLTLWRRRSLYPCEIGAGGTSCLIAIELLGRQQLGPFVDAESLRPLMDRRSLVGEFECVALQEAQKAPASWRNARVVIAKRAAGVLTILTLQALRRGQSEPCVGRPSRGVERRQHAR